MRLEPTVLTTLNLLNVVERVDLVLQNETKDRILNESQGCLRERRKKAMSCNS